MLGDRARVLEPLGGPNKLKWARQVDAVASNRSRTRDEGVLGRTRSLDRFVGRASGQALQRIDHRINRSIPQRNAGDAHAVTGELALRHCEQAKGMSG